MKNTKEITLNRRNKFEPRPNLIISQFKLKAKMVIEVFDLNKNKLKYQFTPFTGYLTIYTDVEKVNVIYE